MAGADDALMLDVEGYVSETNATNVFCVREGRVWTPHADSCLPGITRGFVMEICERIGVPCGEKRLSLSEFHSADEVRTHETLAFFR